MTKADIAEELKVNMNQMISQLKRNDCKDVDYKKGKLVGFHLAYVMLTGKQFEPAIRLV